MQDLKYSPAKNCSVYNLLGAQRWPYESCSFVTAQTATQREATKTEHTHTLQMAHSDITRKPHADRIPQKNRDNNRKRQKTLPPSIIWSRCAAKRGWNSATDAKNSTNTVQAITDSLHMPGQTPFSHPCTCHKGCPHHKHVKPIAPATEKSDS